MLCWKKPNGMTGPSLGRTVRTRSGKLDPPWPSERLPGEKAGREKADGIQDWGVLQVTQKGAGEGASPVLPKLGYGGGASGLTNVQPCPDLHGNVQVTLESSLIILSFKRSMEGSVNK